MEMIEMNIHKHILSLEPGLYQETMMSLYHISNAQTHLKLEKCLEVPADQRNQMIIIVLIDLIRELKNLPAYGGADFDSEYKTFQFEKDSAQSKIEEDVDDLTIEIDDKKEDFKVYIEKVENEIEFLLEKIRKKAE